MGCIGAVCHVGATLWQARWPGNALGPLVPRGAALQAARGGRAAPEVRHFAAPLRAYRAWPRPTRRARAAPGGHFMAVPAPPGAGARPSAGHARPCELPRGSGQHAVACRPSFLGGNGRHLATAWPGRQEARTATECSLLAPSSPSPASLGRPPSRSASCGPAGALFSAQKSLGTTCTHMGRHGAPSRPRRRQAEVAMAPAPRNAAMPPAQSMAEEPAGPGPKRAAGPAAASTPRPPRPACCQREGRSQSCGTPGPRRKRMVAPPPGPPWGAEEALASAAAAAVDSVPGPQSTSTSTGAAPPSPPRKGPRHAAAL
mmetsp:Transcript_42446/g.131461  ORF Transcript_42446/g.131461 Transcript_42446/m.131461 type:complete len:315 (+) Transcript_42446:48-992(+)